jgi:hypothetical protein
MTKLPAGKTVKVKDGTAGLPVAAPRFGPEIALQIYLPAAL